MPIEQINWHSCIDITMNEGLAVIRNHKGQWIGVEGPFLASETPNKEFPSFYLNNFSLTDPLPWKIGRRQLSEAELNQRFSQLGNRSIQVNWDTFDSSTFSDIFHQIQSKIATGELEKAVPSAVLEGQIITGNASSFFSFLRNAPAQVFAYGFFEGNRGFCGISPEILLQTSGRNVNTVALAGSSSQAEAHTLNQDPKEIREHEIVAGYIYDKLSTLGKAKRHPRQLHPLGNIVHLASKLELFLERNWQAEELIYKLHPTPALGTQPRTEEALQQLYSWRKQLQVPSEFGAPFGVYHEGKLEILVAIRGLWWNQAKLLLPSGCGIIKQSNLPSELNELELKRQWVKDFFAI